MILFLDFDGVLHPNREDAIFFCCLPLLWQLLRERPEIRVVFSTSWRFQRTLPELQACVCTGGGEDLAQRFIGATPALYHPTEAASREQDCRAWLAEARLTDCPWLALDDMPGLFSRDTPHLYTVDPEHGLKHDDIERISQQLTRPDTQICP